MKVFIFIAGICYIYCVLTGKMDPPKDNSDYPTIVIIKKDKNEK